jgi:hypothetical protein
MADIRGGVQYFPSPGPDDIWLFCSLSFDDARSCLSQDLFFLALLL